jgi:hypothetical protein
MNENKKLIKTLPIIIGLGLGASAHAEECNINTSLQVANSFTNLVGVQTVDESILQPSASIQCGEYKLYSTAVETLKGDLDSYVIGGMKLFPIEDIPVTFRASLDHLRLNNADKDISRARIGATYKGDHVTINLDHWELVDGSNNGFTKWNLSKTWSLENNLKLTGSIGGSLNKDFSFTNQHYGNVSAHYNLDDSTSIYGKYTHQIDPIQTNQFVFGVKSKF